MGGFSAVVEGRLQGEVGQDRQPEPLAACRGREVDLSRRLVFCAVQLPSAVRVQFRASTYISTVVFCLTVSQVPRLREGTVRLETFLLVPYQRGHPVSPGLPPPAP